MTGPDAPTSDGDALLRAVLLTWSHYDRADLEAGAALLRADPALGSLDPHLMAACGRAGELAAALRADPGAVERDGGPHGWTPLMHAACSRLSLVAPDLAGDPVATVRVLLDAGADLETGFLWHGLVPPFTALTAVLGGGERGEPPHPDAVVLAELLLEAGADPNDGQALYNRMFESDDSHLPPLLRHGLGRPHAGAWRDRLGPTALPAPEVLVGDHLCFAAQHGYVARVRLLLEHGVDPRSRGTHPVLHGRTAHELAVRTGHLEVADLLAAAGGADDDIDPADLLVGAALAGDATRVQGLVAGDPGLARRAAASRPDALRVAGERHDRAAVELLLQLGFGVDTREPYGRTALHEAALRGDTELCDWLLERGADPTLVDREFGGTPGRLGPPRRSRGPGGAAQPGGGRLDGRVISAGRCPARWRARRS